MQNPWAGSQSATKPIPPPPGPRTARAIHANEGIRAGLRGSMLSLIGEMHSDAELWLTQQYHAAPPLQAQDASPAREMQKRFQEVAKKWIRRFEKQAPEIAKKYVYAQYAATDSAMRMALRDVGFEVKFKMTRAMSDALTASLNENVSLIKSIPTQYLQQVEGVMSRAYASGQTLKEVVTRLRKLYPKAADRAVVIARDQTNKANAVVVKARQLELGITEAIWIHSHGGKVPRPDHLAANGRRYKIAEGCLISGELIQPGELINCRCVSRPVLPTLQGSLSL